jgi:hypothetical protein
MRPNREERQQKEKRDRKKNTRAHEHNVEKSATMKQPNTAKGNDKIQPHS